MPKPPTKIRLDQLLVQRGLAESREKAKALIMAGLVQVDGTRVDKAGRLVPASASVLLKGTHPYVSRGGQKLEASIRHFDVEVKDKILLDVGASTGGFTDCLLQNGAQKVIAVDVGYGQLDWKLRQDLRVAVLEKTNIRYLKPEDLDTPIHGATIDVSFISLKLVVPPVSNLLEKQAFIMALIKPQFEVGKGQVGKGGVVRDPSLHQEVIEQLRTFFETLDWTVQGHISSPLLGPKGNKEFLIYLTR
jgi:23S rRNA (cytidine1920-2'-O)/16S rRNA (cytidine1409-2'-O)-methyltransferase